MEKKKSRKKTIFIVLLIALVIILLAVFIDFGAVLDALKRADFRIMAVGAAPVVGWIPVDLSARALFVGQPAGIPDHLQHRQHQLHDPDGDPIVCARPAGRHHSRWLHR